MSKMLTTEWTPHGVGKKVLTKRFLAETGLPGLLHVFQGEPPRRRRQAEQDQVRGALRRRPEGSEGSRQLLQQGQ